MRDSSKRMTTDGLSNIHYKVETIKYEKLYTFVRVSLDKNELRKNITVQSKDSNWYPKHRQLDMNNHLIYPKVPNKHSQWTGERRNSFTKDNKSLAFLLTKSDNARIHNSDTDTEQEQLTLMKLLGHNRQHQPHRSDVQYPPGQHYEQNSYRQKYAEKWANKNTDMLQRLYKQFSKHSMRFPKTSHISNRMFAREYIDVDPQY